MIKPILMAKCPLCLRYLQYEECDIEKGTIKTFDGSHYIEHLTINCPYCGSFVPVHNPCGFRKDR